MKARNTYETRKKRERTMGEFLTRAISVVAVVVCLNGYNTVLDKENRQKNSSESSRRNWNRNSQSMQQRKAQSQTVLIKTEPIPEKHRDLADRWMWK